jgi:hypothetical protein
MPEQGCMTHEVSPFEVVGSGMKLRVENVNPEWRTPTEHGSSVGPNALGKKAIHPWRAIGIGYREA